MMSMYLCPWLDVTGNRPAWSVYIFPVSSTVANVKWVGSLFIFCVGGVSFSVSFVFVLVDRTFFRDWSMCPLCMSIEAGKCLLSAAYVSPGHEWKKPCLMAFNHVVLVGLNAVA
jgi:hypothetical protein